ncbi:BQ2448_7107 [Microbotryum intermedium]|uniref:Sugar phosphate phosphatase n=1 Tax=Microbotryum intermedium TaxID=269621 RepID=A0A238FH94_9BASI|nr:BQ2448_7107 [Microbotryum intermedium]
MPSTWKPSVELCSASQETSFAYESTVKRWPTILTGVIDELSKLNGHLLQPQDEAKLKESKALINEIAGLIYEMRHDRELSDIDASAGLPDDVKLYNNVLAAARAEGKPIKWFNASWLYADYRRLRAMFASTVHWRTFDCFASQKLGAFRSSATGIYALARSVQDLVKKGQPNEQELQADLIKMLAICLWGNATDLSLLTSFTHEDIQALQTVERGADFVLKNDFAKVWQHVKTLEKKRIDIVLDNSGFELYSDLVLGDWLLVSPLLSQTLSPFCSEIVFHPKLIPWFVSDVQPHDFKILLSSLLDPSFFPSDSGATDEDRQALKAMVERWQSYIGKGVFRLSTPLDLEMGASGGEIADFWTGPQAFADLPSDAPELLKELKKASLVIFKGDLNYVRPFTFGDHTCAVLNCQIHLTLVSVQRKLTYDACWPTTTPFEDTLGPLKGEFDILSLRTCKADVCVGLEEGKADELDRTDPNWRVSGKYAVVSFVPRS